MSTSIHPAFRLSADLDLLGFSGRLRDALTPHLTERFQRIVVDKAVRAYDEGHPDDSPLTSCKDKPFSEFLSMYAVYLSRALFGMDDGLFDRYDLSSLRRIADGNGVILRNPVRDELYVLLSDGVAGEEESESAVLGVEGVVSDYSYWDATDSQLEWLSEDEWRDRKKAWSETLDYTKGVPEQGLVVRFFSSRSSYDLLGWRVFEGRSGALLPDNCWEARFRRLVFNRYMGEWGKTHRDPDSDGLSDMFEALKFLKVENERDYSMLPSVAEHQGLLDEAIRRAEERISGFPIQF